MVGDSNSSAVAPRRRSTPSSRSASSTRAAASASTRGSNRSTAWTSVTCEPTRAKNCASSQPTGPPPSTTNERGTSSASVASTFVQYGTCSSPGIGGNAGEDPVAITNRSYGSSCPSTRTRPGSATTASPRTSSQRWPSSHSTCEESSRSATTSRQARTAGTSSSAGVPIPGVRRVAATSSGPRSIVFVGMHAQ